MNWSNSLRLPENKLTWFGTRWTSKHSQHKGQTSWILMKCLCIHHFKYVSQQGFVKGSDVYFNKTKKCPKITNVRLNDREVSVFTHRTVTLLSIHPQCSYFIVSQHWIKVDLCWAAMFFVLMCNFLVWQPKNLKGLYVVFKMEITYQ